MTNLVPIQQPASTFHKDEGGKTNASCGGGCVTLSFRVRLDGDIDIAVGGSKGEIPFQVLAVFEDGTIVPKQREVLDVLGCTEKPTGEPCLSLTSRIGGVSYRLKQVSKRMDDRKICIRLSLPDSLGIPTVVSEGTLVFSKRKNKEQREIQQLQEKQDMERREEEAVQQLLLQAKRQRTMTTTTTTSPSTTTTATNVDSGSLQEEVQQLKLRISELERVVRNQQETISLFLPGPPTLGRTLSQAAWGINPASISPSSPATEVAAVATGAVGTVGEEPRNGSHSSPVSLFGIPPDLRRENSGEGGMMFLNHIPLQRLSTTDFTASGPPMLRRETSAELELPHFDDSG